MHFLVVPVNLQIRQCQKPPVPMKRRPVYSIRTPSEVGLTARFTWAIYKFADDTKPMLSSHALFATAAAARAAAQEALHTHFGARASTRRELLSARRKARLAGAIVDDGSGKLDRWSSDPR